MLAFIFPSENLPTLTLRKNRSYLNNNHALEEYPFHSIAPGRINLIGEHTDYNGGWVLPAAIKQSMHFGFKLNQKGIIRIKAIDSGEEILIDPKAIKKGQYNWSHYLEGILVEFQKRGIDIPGIDCGFTSDIPIGAGLSSSSALECAFANGLNDLLDCSFSNWDLVNISQQSNHNYLNIRGGILDQFSILFGEKNHALLLNCKTNTYEKIAIPEKDDSSFLLINSNVIHDHMTSGYNHRVNSCVAALKTIRQTKDNIEKLSDLKQVSEIEDITFENSTLKRRVEFIIEENERVLSFVKALKKEDWTRCGALLNYSHNGLSKKYEVSCPELDFLVDILKSKEAVLGSRMMGGGFGGCTLNLIKKSQQDTIKEYVYHTYISKFNIVPEFIEVEISDGAQTYFNTKNC